MQREADPYIVDFCVDVVLVGMYLQALLQLDYAFALNILSPIFGSSWRIYLCVCHCILNTYYKRTEF